MRRQWRFRVGFVVICLLLLAGTGGAIWAWSSGRALELRRVRTTERLAAKHRARLRWDEALARLKRHVYSEDLRRALIPEDGRPVVVKGTPEDVRKADGGYVARFYTFQDFPSGPDSGGVVFQVRCSPFLANTVLRCEERNGGSFAIVARFAEVKRFAFFTGDEEDAASPCAWFLAVGDCSDLALLE